MTYDPFSYVDAQRGIPQGTNAYTDLQAAISKMEQLVTSLNEFHSNVIGLDSNHQDQVVTLSNVLMTLYNSNTPFQGKGADTLLQLLSDYQKQEVAFTGHQGDTSPQLAQATTFCQNTARAINDELQTLYREADQFAYQVDLARNVAPPLRVVRRIFEPSFPSDEVIDASCALPPSTPLRVNNMQWDEELWGNQMDNLGREPLPVLPPPPTDPKFIIPFPVALNAQQELDLQQLTREFPDVAPEDIKGLLLAGFTPDEIRAILRAGFTHSQIQAIINRVRIAQQDPHGTDRQGLTVAQIRDLVMRVVAALNAPSAQTQLEGQVARAVIADLVSFQRIIHDPVTGEVVGEIDVETSTAIIEVTTTPSGKLEQLLREQNNPLINPEGKNVILYGPDYSHLADLQFAEHDIPIARNMQELFEELRLLGFNL
ncbi:MAG TPA: hypothetical protein VFB60_01565 [Ktedonobacteraceae bacterium]|nr:hypothetical protein [Ktedonobacteraceae bacterium]